MYCRNNIFIFNLVTYWLAENNIFKKKGQVFMNLDVKLKEFNQIIEETANKEYTEIEQKMEKEIQDAIEQEINEYENKKNISYEKNVQKIEKEYK